MPEKPLLIFPQPKISAKKKGTCRPGSDIHYPSHQRQVERISPQFEELARVIEARKIAIKDDPSGAESEMVLVLETIGTVESFITVVKNISGMEWLCEWDEDEIESDDDFHYEDVKKRGKEITGRLYLVMTNQQAMRELLSLYERWKTADDAKFDLEQGRTGLRDMFNQLRNIRPWNEKDRLYETGFMEEWEERKKEGREILRFEIELWYKQNHYARCYLNKAIIKEELEKLGGKIINEVIVDEIAYHAILAELSIDKIEILLYNREVKLIQLDEIMFLRPVGQCTATTHDDVTDTMNEPYKGTLPHGDPVIALLDGLPLENHLLLNGRLIIDDPDNWSNHYQAKERSHGTAMASLIIHDELDVKTAIPLSRPIYVRPIMKPKKENYKGIREEGIPENELLIDLIHRSVKRLFEGDEGTTYSSIRIINLSIGDPRRLFYRVMSPWAKLLDWLSWKYKVLFVVSAGNCTDDIVLKEVQASSFSPFKELRPEELQLLVLKSLCISSRNRRIMSPSESINALTVASTHKDFCDNFIQGNSVNLLDDNMPSPFNPVGLGFRKAIKPDVLNRGGRQLYMEIPGNTHLYTTFKICDTNRAPGQKVAAAHSEGRLNGTRYCCGTSNSAALTTRLAAQLYETIEGLQISEEILTDNNIAVLIKALITYSARYEDCFTDMKKVTNQFSKRKEYFHRFVGYGSINQDRVLFCTDQRATLIGCGVIKKDEALIYSIPLPFGLSGKKVSRRLVITLAWISPVNTMQQKYRIASLKFTCAKDKLKDMLKVDRVYDYNAVSRGTVQHEVFEGEKATAFLQNDNLKFEIECKEDAGDLIETIPYAVVVTLEVAEGINIPIYNEIQEKLRSLVSIQAV